jgi:hypothetical protein
LEASAVKDTEEFAPTAREPVEGVIESQPLFLASAMV